MKERRRPLVAEIKRNSLDDGPGIRSVVFFKGCPLSCVWCHNPECITAAPEIAFRQEKCVGSRDCSRVCGEEAIGEEGPAAIDRRACTLCGECAEECPSGALAIVGRYYEPGELIEILCRDQAFYENSGGGVTLSGGEPTLFVDYAAEVARQLAGRDIAVLLETCGDFDWERFAAKLLPHLETIYVDLKLDPDDLHRKFTGRGNARIKGNIEKLLAQDSAEVLVRVPLVPDITATPGNLRAIASWLAGRNVERVALMPYNPLWTSKTRALGRTPAYERATWMSDTERATAKEIFAGFELARDF
jgi:pyruvate formate lyase activating enzyme